MWQLGRSRKVAGLIGLIPGLVGLDSGDGRGGANEEQSPMIRSWSV